MKQSTIQGFGSYTILDNGTVKNANGKNVKITKGKVTLTADEDVPENSIIKGENYAFEVKTLLEACANSWVDVPEAPAHTEVAEGFDLSEGEEKTPEDLAKEKRKELKNAVSEASKALLNATIKGEDTTTLRQAFLDAQKALDDFDASNVPQESEELKAARSEYQMIEDELDNMRADLKQKREDLEKQAEVIKGLGGKAPKKAKDGTVSEGNKAAHIGYDTAQNIRKDYAIGRFGNEGEAMTVKQIADKYSCSASAVNYYVNYLQHKLKKGDTEYTPLVNEYYPALGEQGNITGTNGAPYVEDNVKEGKEKYTIAKNRVAVAAS